MLSFFIVLYTARGYNPLLKFCFVGRLDIVCGTTRCILFSSIFLRLFFLYFISKANHAALVLLDKRHTVGLGVFRGRKQHALVTLGLFLLANAAGLHRGISGHVKVIA